ncbi:hypothetical protein FGO68_gene9841 [Halteria grandinella]|uniref:Uncharacterized protein n=1 Tax=Halteria grandinella TaxID=5974 RepID=A0A8J8NH03_HALGN|nr:hypothetical protein FGO68_gene9841 [Halteria grandinella]
MYPCRHIRHPCLPLTGSAASQTKQSSMVTTVYKCMREWYYIGEVPQVAVEAHCELEGWRLGLQPLGMGQVRGQGA